MLLDSFYKEVVPDYKGVSGGSRVEAAAGGGSNVGTGSPAAVFSPWGSTGACGDCSNLGRLLAQDDDNIQAIRAQLRKARGTWARVGQVLRAENVPPQVAAKFYKAVVQAMLLYGSKTWVLSMAALASLEGFHIRAAYGMAVRHKLWRGPGNRWIYPKSKGDEHAGGQSVDRQSRCMWQPARS